MHLHCPQRRGPLSFQESTLALGRRQSRLGNSNRDVPRAGLCWSRGPQRSRPPGAPWAPTDEGDANGASFDKAGYEPELPVYVYGLMETFAADGLET